MTSRFAISEAYARQAQRLIAPWKDRESHHETMNGAIADMYLQRVHGAHVWDVDGNRYIDFCMAFGTVILGHNDPDVMVAVERQLYEGTSFSLWHPLQLDIAGLLTRVVPCAEMVAFSRSPTESLAHAVRAARAYSGRDVIVWCDHYGDEELHAATYRRLRSALHVKHLIPTFTYGDVESLRGVLKQHAGHVAAVVLEPLAMEMPCGNFLQQTAELTRKAGALLIFDETHTGFRVSVGGAQEYAHVRPDLACFGNIMANGFSLAALVGSQAVMSSSEVVTYSFDDDPDLLSFAACGATIEKLRAQPVLFHIWSLGDKLKAGINALAQKHGLHEHVECLGLAARTLMAFKDRHGRISIPLMTLFQQELRAHGVLMSGAFHIALAHSHEDIDRTLEVCDVALESVGRALDAMRMT
jgi:glutamate-1-semialdehyde aminotransferase